MKQKFKVWHKHEKRWINDAFMKQNGAVSHDTILNPSINLVAYLNSDLKDVNETEIFEGDILECPWHDFHETVFYGVVVLWLGAFRLAKFKSSTFPELTRYELFNDNDIPTRLFLWDKAKIVGNLCETTVWVRHPEKDCRMQKGDNFAGDAWRNVLTNQIKYTTVGYNLSKTYPFKS